MLGGLAIRKHRVLSPLLIFVLAWIFIGQSWVIGLGICNCCGSSCYPCPNRALIEQHIWNKEISNFLSCDDCYSSINPGYARTPEINQPINGTASYWLDKGNNSYLAGSYEEAEESYARAVDIDPSLMEGWLNMGNALFFLGRYQESLNAYDAALRLEPQNANALEGKRRILLALNRTAEADSTLETAHVL
ncbi:MAG: tetratricopeptide repeat protein [Methanotrichaceae archaeon]